MKIYGFIPARYGSTRLPGKPLALIAGRPMIVHVYERARLSSVLEKVVVATDDERIKKVVEEIEGEALLTSKEHTCGTERIAEAAEILRLAPDDIVVNIQADQPLLEPAVIEELVKPLLLNADLPMATVAVPIEREEDKHDPNRVKVVLNKEGQAIYFSRSLIPFYRPPGPSPTYLRHIGLYAYRKEFLDTFVRLSPGELEQAEKLEQLRALEHGYPIAVSVTKYECPEVDTPEDLKKIEELLAK
ncbi:3-deoxy-D-manno-octulosonatecytidylyltransferase [Thermodesulfatator indicus DSM 15286]|uniref:3-deoxy-manno-octulosonate cytidylyltransferase n=1 Tax=Thermodesulfatator indicus (strain DSM 15286 / JCM 11887 / CIR29812) TaxID=667014 RepID=F8ADJ4_THEID|nr:3-deoxy-manno-octulosonate cytidylyltransferase [Thermodesulfatator indicus]AEH44868.1 3-deoxy-D-manno-octulosonatecytidylyltransferase [Thermodesulfatator indicus DSM 15286]